MQPLAVIAPMGPSWQSTSASLGGGRPASLAGLCKGAAGKALFLPRKTPCAVRERPVSSQGNWSVLFPVSLPQREHPPRKVTAGGHRHVACRLSQTTWIWRYRTYPSSQTPEHTNLAKLALGHGDSPCAGSEDTLPALSGLKPRPRQGAAVLLRLQTLPGHFTSKVTASATP